MRGLLQARLQRGLRTLPLRRESGHDEMILNIVQKQCY
jgi:hypothetical protein